MLYIFTVLLYVYELRKDGQRLGRLWQATCGPRHADLRMTWNADGGGAMRRPVAVARLIGKHGLEVVEPLLVRAILIRPSGMLLVGQQRTFQQRTSKSKSMMARQSWFCAAEPVRLPSPEDIQSGKIAGADVVEGVIHPAFLRGSG